MSFSSLQLIEPLIRAVTEAGYEHASPIQVKAIPEILSGRDVMAAAQTGTGKTAGFTLPILQGLADGEKARANQARALILTPTRELAAQVEQSVKTYSQYLKVTSFVVFGGVKINPQMVRLGRGVDVLVATPGRLLDLMNQKAISFDHLEFLVLDEADRMLDMGFLPDIKRILSKLPGKRQNLLFSATFSADIRQLCQGLLNNPVSISVSPANSTANSVTHWIHPVDKKQKSKLLSYLIGHNQWQQVLVFVKTKRGANKIAYDLEKDGINAAAIHGNKSQGARTRALAEFKAGNIRALIATDIAARGLDIVQLPQVVNLDLPKVAEDYVHRIGRTGRAGAAGQAISLVCADEVKELNAIENLIQKKLDRKLIDGFEPNHTVPETYLRAKSGPKKPHKKKIAKALTRGKSVYQNEGLTAKPKRRKPSKGLATVGGQQKAESQNTENRKSSKLKSSKPKNRNRKSDSNKSSRDATSGRVRANHPKRSRSSKPSA